MVRLQLEISKYVTGFVHVQTNPYYSYDTVRTVKNAESTASSRNIYEYLLIHARNCGTFQAPGQ